MEFTLDNPPSLTDPTSYDLEITLSTFGFLIARESKVSDPPSDRFSQFNELWNAALDEVIAVAESFNSVDGVPPRETFNAAKAAYRPPNEILAPAMAELDRLGLLEAMEALIVPPPSEGHHNLTGTVELYDEDGGWLLPICSGDGGYDDLQYGSQVTVRDASGTIIGTGSLDLGETQSETTCLFRFLVTDLPETEFYSISIGRREGPAYSFDEMVLRDWHIDLSIGDR